MSKKLCRMAVCYAGENVGALVEENIGESGLGTRLHSHSRFPLKRQD